MKKGKLKVEIDIDKLPKTLYRSLLKEIMEEMDIFFTPEGTLIPMADWDAVDKIPTKKQQNLKDIIKNEAKLNPELINDYIKLFKECVEILEKRKKKTK